VVARLGQLYLGAGAWGGRQLLSRSWVDEATRARVATGLEGADGAWYGYQFRVSQHGYRADGAYGQYCLVLPQHDAVVAITAPTRSPGRPDMQTVLSLVSEKLVPAFGAHALVATEADERLAARLGSLALPAVGGGRAVRLYREATGWVVVLCDDGSELRARLGQGTWAVEERAPARGHSVPVACSGASHRLSINCDLGGGTFVARWSSRPVHAASLAGLGAPGGRH